MTIPPNTTPAVSPATDEEIAEDQQAISTEGPGCGDNCDIWRAKLLARIRQEQERVKERDNEIAVRDSEIKIHRSELAAQGAIVAQLHKDLVNANAAIARMKAGHDEIIESRTALRLIPLRAELAAEKETHLETFKQCDRASSALAASTNAHGKTLAELAACREENERLREELAIEMLTRAALGERG